MNKFLLIMFFIVSFTLISLIILQQGKSPDETSSLGGGASNTLFGSSGSATFMTRATALFATLFFIISLLLGNINNGKNNKIITLKDSNLSEKINPYQENKN